MSENCMQKDPLPHPRALAFLGDAVFEIYVRKLAVAQGFSHSQDLHRYTTARVKATQQVALLHFLKPHLSEAELEIIRQGRNMGVATARRNEQAAHRQATGLEALLGALYLNQPQRLEELWQLAQPFLEAEPAPEPLPE